MQAHCVKAQPPPINIISHCNKKKKTCQSTLQKITHITLYIYTSSKRINRNVTPSPAPRRRRKHSASAADISSDNHVVAAAASLHAQVCVYTRKRRSAGRLGLGSPHRLITFIALSPSLAVVRNLPRGARENSTGRDFRRSGGGMWSAASRCVRVDFRWFRRFGEAAVVPGVRADWIIRVAVLRRLFGDSGGVFARFCLGLGG